MGQCEGCEDVWGSVRGVGQCEGCEDVWGSVRGVRSFSGWIGCVSGGVLQVCEWEGIAGV